MPTLICKHLCGFVTHVRFVGTHAQRFLSFLMRFVLSRFPVLFHFTHFSHFMLLRELLVVRLPLLRCSCGKRFTVFAKYRVHSRLCDGIPSPQNAKGRRSRTTRRRKTRSASPRLEGGANLCFPDDIVHLCSFYCC